MYERRLNVFFRARPESVRARLKGAEAVRQQQLDAATRKFEAVHRHPASPVCQAGNQRGPELTATGPPDVFR